MTDKPKATSAKMEQELDKIDNQFKSFDAQVKSLNVDEMNTAPVKDFEPQTRISDRQASRMAELVYIKPARTIGPREKFNENFRMQWEEAKKYVKCVMENNEVKGERLEFWTKPFPGVNCEYWEIPVNKPVMVPAHVAEQISRKWYHRMVMDEGKVTSADGMGTFYGALAVKETIRRLDARPVGNGFISMAS